MFYLHSPIHDFVSHYCSSPLKEVRNFEALYIDENGLKKKKMYQMYVRDLSLNIKTVINPKLDTILLEKGYYEKYLINGIYFGLIDLHGAGNIMEKDIRDKGGLIYPEKITK